MTEGPARLAHGNRGKASSQKWDTSKEIFAINLLKGEWHNFGPTFAAEKLAEQFNIKISAEALRKCMIKAGVWTIN